MRELRNPFRVAEHVRDAYFTDRADEVAVVRRAIADRARLLVTGPRRMGKSTVIGVAAEHMEAAGGTVLQADLATASSLTEVSNRLLRAVAAVEPWRDRLAEWARSLAPVVTLGYDPSGLPRLSVVLESRPRGEEGERELLERVLDRVEAVASESSSPVVVVLDEFQRIAELGGEAAEWLLRRRMQENRTTGYVCAGSKESLIAEMLQPQRAFYKFFDRLELGPIDADHLARWIDSRLTGAGVEADGVGRELVERVGPRTQDIVQAARVLWFRCAQEGEAGPGSVDGAIAEIVTQDDPALRRTFDHLTPLQQRILRAVAAGAEQLHSTDTRERFALGAASSVATGLEALVSRAILVRTGHGVAFDNPYFREWAKRELVG
ncbi:MAG: AAA family ATPase [Candidatus Longimicrobiales bacterium M2_2A_002]